MSRDTEPSPFVNMPLCQHSIQFDCDQCFLEDLQIENRRMQWLLQHVLTPGEEFTLWDTYKNADEEYWKRQGL